MKTTTSIFYFSGTGNSLMVARHLADSLGDSELIPISKVIDSEIDLTSEKIGLVFPVHISGIPEIVNTFIQQNFRIFSR